CILRGPAALAGDHVGGVPPRPVMLRSGPFVSAVVLLGLLEKLRQSPDVQSAETPPGEPRRDLLEEPAVPVGIAERGPRAVSAVLRVAARRAPLRPGDAEVALEVEDLAHLGATL